MIENFIDRDKDGQADGGYRGILSLIDAIETENYRDAQILYPASYRITRRASREQVSVVREFVWLQMLNRGLKTWGIAVRTPIPSMAMESEVHELTPGARPTNPPKSIGGKSVGDPKPVR